MSIISFKKKVLQSLKCILGIEKKVNQTPVALLKSNENLNNTDFPISEVHIELLTLEQVEQLDLSVYAIDANSLKPHTRLH